jgi:hypothetical protein
MSNDENINSGTETARDPGADIKSAALAEMAKSESIESYAAERADQDAEAAGKQPTTPPEERVNRYQAALEQARQETDQARRENGLDGEPNDFDAQVDQAIQAQVQEQELEAEFARREKQGADVALYTHKANQELDQHPGFWEAVKATFTAIPPTTEIAEQILSCEHGPEIVWRMCQHPEAIEQLNALPPKEAERMIAKLDGAIMAERQVAKRFAGYSQPRRETRAPPVFKTPSGGARPPQDLHQLASRGERADDYVKARRAMDKRRDD